MGVGRRPSLIRPGIAVAMLLNLDHRPTSADAIGVASPAACRQVVVAVLTFQRPETLANLLAAYAELDPPAGAVATLLVVDNDAAASARGVVEAWQGRIPGLRYVVEPRAGIPVARNRALDEARALGADALCFIDDDEYPDRRWLAELVAAWQATGADLLGGPVRVAAPPAGSSRWQRFVNTSLAARGRRKERDAARDAARGRCRTIVTNNFLCDLRGIGRHGLRFDEALLVTGGSDTDFFRRAVAAGCRTAWCPTAIVHETIEAERLSLRYQFRRGSFQSLNHFHMKQVTVTPLVAAITFGNAVLRALLGAILLVVPVYGRASLVMAVRSLGWSVGRVSALRGGRSTLYAHEPPAEVASPAAWGEGEVEPDAGGETPAPEQGLGLRTILRLFRETVATNKAEYGLAVVAMACVAGATAGLAGLMRSAINDVYVHRDLRAMWLVAGGIVLLSVIKGAADYAQAVVMTRIGNRVTATVQRRLFDRLLASKLSFFTKMHSSKVITQINAKAQAASKLLDIVTTSLARDLLTLLGLGAVMVYQDPLLSLVAVMFGPVIMLGTQLIVRQIRRLADAEIQGIAGVVAAVQETCQGIRTVKAFNLEPEMRRRLGTAVADVEARGNAIARIGRLTSPLMESLGGVVIAAMVVYSGWQTVNHGKSPGEFMAFVTAFLLAYEPAKRLAGVQVTLTRSLDRVARMYATLDKPPGEPVDLPALPAAGIRGHVEIRDVSFGYGRKDVVHGVSLDIRPGEITALVGPSGAGKSTLFGLLQRFHDPRKGSITIDGHDITAFDPHSIRQVLAVVSQDTTLFRGSIGENIRLGAPEATTAEIEAAARAAAADAFVAAMPEGFDTLVGERQATLSGGQAQRLAIARAVIRNAPILLLDEATSALDGETERAVRDALAALMEGRTTVVIAHRSSTIERADRIYVLDHGRVVACGRHEELLGSSPLYRTLFGGAQRAEAAARAA
jgi:subfamily B ATP-binding cassette protein MsbA